MRRRLPAPHTFVDTSRHTAQVVGVVHVVHRCIGAHDRHDMCSDRRLGVGVGQAEGMLDDGVEFELGTARVPFEVLHSGVARVPRCDTVGMCNTNRIIPPSRICAGLTDGLFNRMAPIL